MSVVAAEIMKEACTARACTWISRGAPSEVKTVRIVVLNVKLNL